MPFGWVNAPFEFQNFMQTKIADHHREYSQVYIDDLVAYSKSKAEHFDHIAAILETVRKAGVRLKLMKCTFFMPQMEYLGHVISREGIRKDPKKILAISKVPPHELKRKLGPSLERLTTMRSSLRIYR